MSSVPPIRTLRAGRYAIVGELGAGSQAETLDAVDKRGGCAVAIKHFRVRGAKSWKDVELAEREARVLSTLSHPNLPVYIEHFEEDGALYLVMEKIEGETLASIRKRKSVLSSEDITRFLSDAERVLAYLHSRVPPIIHRDIKPGNVIRRADGGFVFVDFGSVRDQLKPEGGSTVVGTFGYMAPEQFQGRALPGSDVYAVAATALSLVTGREPEDLPHRGLGIDVAAALGPGADPWLVRALAGMLEPDPDKRPAKVTLRRPSSGGSSRPQGESRGERRERERAERAAERNGAQNPWYGNAHAWQNFAGVDFREQGREQRQQMKAESRRMRRELKRQIQDETRRFKRHARDFQRSRPEHWERHRHGFGPAAPLLISVVVFGLLLARLGTWALFRVFLPILLSILSIFFGRSLQRAAWRCREIGVEGERGLQHAMQAVRGRILGRDDIDIDIEGEESDKTEAERDDAVSPFARAPRTRVQGERARVEGSPQTPDPDELDDLADDDEQRRRGQR